MAIDNQVQILYSKILLQLFDELLVLGPVIGEPAGLPQIFYLITVFIKRRHRGAGYQNILIHRSCINTLC